MCVYKINSINRNVSATEANKERMMSRDDGLIESNCKTPLADLLLSPN